MIVQCTIFVDEVGGRRMGDLHFYINLVLTAGLLPTHLALGPLKSRPGQIALFFLILAWLIYCVTLSFEDNIRARDMMLGLASYAIGLFVWLSDILMNGGAARLTKWRGEKWTKEIDYVYLSIGAFGLITSLGQLPNVSHKITMPMMFGPFVIATAIVIRAIKTRAEIDGWNRLK